MLYAISMVVDEPTLVQSILTAALLSEVRWVIVGWRFHWKSDHTN